jgi:iron complex outermembrane receptor protein
MLGYSWQHFYSADRSITYYNETGEQYEKSTGVWSRQESYLVSFYGRVNYSYASRYLLTVTLRADGSSKFAKGNRWGYFPSAAFAWNILNEPFMEGQDVVSSLKLRLGYGETGQQEIGNYMYLARYSVSENDLSHMANMGSDGLSHMLAPSAYDPNIRWESTITYNAGIDFGFFDGLIDGSVDVYRRDTKDLLNWVTTPMGANFGILPPIEPKIRDKRERFFFHLRLNKRIQIFHFFLKCGRQVCVEHKRIAVFNFKLGVG